MNCSTDVVLTPDKFRRLYDLYQEFGVSGAVRADTSNSGLITLEDIKSKKFAGRLLRSAIDYFDYPDDFQNKIVGDPIAGYRALAIGRNTLSITSLDLIKQMGGWDPSSNTVGGMEDAQAWVRLSKIQPHLISDMLTAAGRELPFHTDDAWDSMGSDASGGIDSEYDFPHINMLEQRGIMLSTKQKNKLNREANARVMNAATINLRYLANTAFLSDRYATIPKISPENQDFLL
jgi:hypothetical protein